jgi:hypothetical protein
MAGKLVTHGVFFFTPVLATTKDKHLAVYARGGLFHLYAVTD